MLPRLDPRWELVATRRLGTEADWARFEARFSSLPDEYREVGRSLTEYQLKHRFGQYLRLWPPGICLEMNEAHRIAERIPDAIPIGDDGGDELLAYMKGNAGFGLYHVGFGALDREEAVFVADSLEQLLTTSVGVLEEDFW